MSELVQKDVYFDRINALVSEYAEFMESLRDQPDDLAERVFKFTDTALQEIGMLRAQIKHLEGVIKRLKQDTNREEGWFVGREVNSDGFIRKGSIVAKNGHAIPEDEIKYMTDEQGEPGVTFADLADQVYTRGDVITVIDRNPDGWRDTVVFQYGLDGSEKWFAMRMSHSWPDM